MQGFYRKNRKNLVSFLARFFMSYFNLEVTFFFEKVRSCLFPNAFFNVGNKGDDVFFSLIEHAWDGKIFRLVIDPSRSS